MTRSRSATTGDSSAEVLPSLRLTAYFDQRSNRPSLTFTPVSRTLPTGKEVIKVGRYSERENHVPIPSNTPSAAPVGFKSKVVSRRHCEFWYEDSKWYIKDVKSSSGTFLNHIRLSAPGTESKPYPLNDGDIVQLGIDFKGGEEMIYRCVKMRVELNRGWQSKPNTFNMATHQRLRNMTSASATSASSHAQDCSICLNNIAPCQSLFVAPCSHTWHYKCIRELLMGPSYPIFICPNCRAATDLDADVEEPEWQQLDGGIDEVQEERAEPSTSPDAIMEDTNVEVPEVESPEGAGSSGPSDDVGDVTMHFDRQSPPRTLTSPPVPIPSSSPSHLPATGEAVRRRRTPSPNSASLAVVTEGPLTPRNDAGPWVFDGNPARVSQDVPRPNAMTSLNAAATERES
ncbi:SMAD/FHA domain-containing protein [Microdochium trichocladiopsis]|uniref:RING-type E3 ubiquitin transferase n=1 Tax=Microdochium trichocladiopsis TaxID=1682393 RepID=A0A9P8YEE3_9PEZI|nr:SMAD/FHA domain-containing protein [Microdochium trichocladiopsis]KAH7037925.1 SMAD/FHA domain-containing protein [Microdochium trichocladiopsis]